jgi:hypothetical protein
MAHPLQNNEFADAAKAHAAGAADHQPWSFIDILRNSAAEITGTGVGIAAGATASALGANRLESALIGAGVGTAAAILSSKAVESGKKVSTTATDAANIIGYATVGGIAVEGAARTAQALAGKAKISGIVQEAVDGATHAYKKMDAYEAAGMAAGITASAALAANGNTAEAIGLAAGTTAMAAMAHKQKLAAAEAESTANGTIRTAATAAGIALAEGAMLGIPGGAALVGGAAAAAGIMRYLHGGGHSHEKSKLVPNSADSPTQNRHLVPNGHLYIPELWE